MVRTDRLLYHIQYMPVNPGISRGIADLYPSQEYNTVTRGSKYHTQLGNMSFDQMFDLAAEVYFLVFFIFSKYVKNCNALQL